MSRDGVENDAAATASPAALEMIHRLGAAHGALVLSQGGRVHRAPTCASRRG